MILAQRLPNIKGEAAGSPLALLDFQCWLITNLFGFVERDNPTLRRFRQASIWVPKGNGKTSLVATLALYCTFVEGEGGAEGYAAAVSREQARITFDLARAMVMRSGPFRRSFGVEVREHSIHQQHTMSRFGPISSDAKSLDGLNVHLAVLDELASHRSKAVYDV
jgi:phage terminase large subunit-like protein